MDGFLNFQSQHPTLFHAVLFGSYGLNSRERRTTLEASFGTNFSYDPFFIEEQARRVSLIFCTVFNFDQRVFSSLCKDIKKIVNRVSKVASLKMLSKQYLDDLNVEENVRFQKIVECTKQLIESDFLVPILKKALVIGCLDHASFYFAFENGNLGLFETLESGPTKNFCIYSIVERHLRDSESDPEPDDLCKYANKMTTDDHFYKSFSVFRSLSRYCWSLQAVWGVNYSQRITEIPNAYIKSMAIYFFTAKLLNKKRQIKESEGRIDSASFEEHDIKNWVVQPQNLFIREAVRNMYWRKRKQGERFLRTTYCLPLLVDLINALNVKNRPTGAWLFTFQPWEIIPIDFENKEKFSKENRIIREILIDRYPENKISKIANYTIRILMNELTLNKKIKKQLICSDLLLLPKNGPYPHGSHFNKESEFLSLKEKQEVRKQLIIHFIKQSIVGDSYEKNTLRIKLINAFEEKEELPDYSCYHSKNYCDCTFDYGSEVE